MNPKTIRIKITQDLLENRLDNIAFCPFEDCKMTLYIPEKTWIIYQLYQYKNRLTSHYCPYHVRLERKKIIQLKKDL